jgi:hypothetical protein
MRVHVVRRTIRGVLIIGGLASCALLAVAHGRADRMSEVAGSRDTEAAGMAHPVAAGSAAPADGPDTDGIAVAGKDAGAVRVPSAPEAWGGPRTGSEPTLSQRVADYELRAVIDPAKHTVEGTEKLHWRNRSDRAVRTLYFHTYLNGFEGEGSTWMTEKARYGRFRSGVEIEDGQWGHIDVVSIAQSGQPAAMRYVQPDGGPATDRSVLRVDLPAEVAPGGDTVLDIAFHDQLPRVIARTGYFDSYHLVAQWFPKIGVLELAGERGAQAPRWNVHEFHLNSEFYADWGSYDLEVVAPRGFTVGAVGTRVGEPRDTPQGVVHHFHQDDVHDVAFTVWDGYAPPLKGSYDGPGSPHVDVEVLYPPEWEGSARAALQATIDTLGHFSRTLGPYPYKHVTCIVPPFNAAESGGMEYETFFTTIGGGPAFDALVRYVTVHEFGHGYFMGLLASNEFEEPFLDEGMNEWWDSRMLGDEQLRFNFGLASQLGFGLPPIRIWDFEWTNGSDLTGRPLADPIAGNSWDRMSRATYGAVYAHTVVVMHDLEHLLGGDAIARGMKLYYARWHHRHPSAADLRDALAEAAPEHAGAIRAWFDDQVYGSGLVDDEVDHVEVEDRGSAGSAAPTGRYRSVVRAQRHGALVPQTLVVEFADGSQDKIAWPASERWHRWVFDRGSKIESARLDASGEILLDVNKLDDGRTREPHKLPARRMALETTTWVDVLLALVSSL